MADEFFADLLPLKPKNVAQKPGSDVKAEQGSLQASSESGSLLGRAPGTSFQEVSSSRSFWTPPHSCKLISRTRVFCYKKVSVSIPQIMRIAYSKPHA